MGGQSGESGKDANKNANQAALAQVSFSPSIFFKCHLYDFELNFKWTPLMTEKYSGPSSVVGCWESVGPCCSPLYGNFLRTVHSYLLFIPVFVFSNCEFCFLVQHWPYFFLGTALYWQFGVEKSSKSWFSREKASWRRTSCSACTECHLVYNLADLYSTGICCCWLCIQVFLWGGYSSDICLASLIIYKLANTKKAGNHTSKCSVYVIIWITIVIASTYVHLKQKMKSGTEKPCVELCKIIEKLVIGLTFMPLLFSNQGIPFQCYNKLRF